jgi:hypothetical protein
MTATLVELLTVPQGAVNLTGYDARATPGFDGGKAEGKAALAALDGELSELQEMLFAEGGPAGPAGCSWSSRGWTPRARAV